MKFLLVDDSETTREIIIKGLNSYGFDDIVESENGEDAFQTLLSTNVDFIITDWNMPKVSGLELVKMIRADISMRHLPILMLTSRGNKEDIIAAVAAKVNNYLIKPFKPEVLMKKINEILLKNIE